MEGDVGGSDRRAIKVVVILVETIVWWANVEWNRGIEVGAKTEEGVSKGVYKLGVDKGRTQYLQREAESYISSEGSSSRFDFE